MLNFSNFKFNKSSVPEDPVKKNEFYKDLEQQFIEEINASESAKEYFSSYSDYSIKSFIKSYASRKVHLAQCYDYYERLYFNKENSDLNYQKQAEKVLFTILQKKLFNIQLLWRAGKMDIHEIATSFDFQFWEKHIASCPFVPSITENEVELIKDYLLQNSNTKQPEDYRDTSWQDYDSIMAKDERGLPIEMPDWYEFYDLRMGTGQLLLLPNDKGAKEEFYMALYRQEILRKNPPKDNSPVDPKPGIYGLGKEFVDFSRYYETDKYFIELFKYYDFSIEEDYRDPNYDDIKTAIQVLFSADRSVYFSKHLNWDKAIIDAVNRYTTIRIVESIDFVYEDYKMMRELGISKYESKEVIRAEYEKESIAAIYRDYILRGRILNGEPADFNY
jgi:hypothetical protein